jgi:CPA2 family monovalent cation:H+ antiporter-2
VQTATRLLELGGVILGLGVLGRVAGRLGLSPIPLYLLAGLAFGTGGLLPLVTTDEFIHTGAEIGVILLLLLLGLEYTAEELTSSLRRSATAGLADLALNFPPGLAAGLLLGWPWLAAVVLGGVSFFGGRGSAVGSICGAFALTLVVNVLFFAHIDPLYQSFYQGLFLIVAVVLGTLVGRLARGRR